MFRGTAQCFKCYKENPQIALLTKLYESIIQAATAGDWCDENLAKVLEDVERFLPRQLLK